MSYWQTLMGTTGIWSAELHFGDQDVAADTAAELEDLGFGAIWYPEGPGGPVFDIAANLLRATRSVAVATGILNVWMHPAHETATGRARLETEFPGRYLLGLGISHPAFVDSDTVRIYGQPLATMRAYIDELQRAHPPVPTDAIVLAALKPKMRELARARTGGIHSYFVPAEHTRLAREMLGPDAFLAPAHAVVLERDATRARELARRYTALYLALPNYRNNLLELGFTETDVSGAGSDRLVDALVAWGDTDTIYNKVSLHREAGADHVCLQIVTDSWGGPPFIPPREQYRELAGALVA